MRKKILLAMALAMLLAMPASSVYAFSSHYGPTELLYYDPTLTYEGYTMFSPWIASATFLIDMKGNLIHTWSIPKGYDPDHHARLMENGILLRSIKGTTPEAVAQRIYQGGDGIIQEVDWDGNVLWQFASAPTGRAQHHDFRKIWNKKLGEYTYIMPTAKNVSRAEVIAAGADPNKLGPIVLYGIMGPHPDGLTEVNRDGKIIWSWDAIDHTVQQDNPNWPRYGIVKDHPEKLDINYGLGIYIYSSTILQVTKDNDWLHLNSLDYNQDLDQIVTNGRKLSEFYVIDHGASFVSTPADFAKNFDAAVAANVAAAKGPAGDFIYRWGNSGVYDEGILSTQVDNVFNSGTQQLWFAHDIHWIPKGLPGEGNFLIFNNGSIRAGEYSIYSEVLEINPRLDAKGNDTGKYVPEPQAGYKLEIMRHPTRPAEGANKLVSNQIVWSYRSKDPTSFYSMYISGAQRLPNGNTMVCSGNVGDFFEVTPTKKVVWEYVNPFFDSSGPQKLMPDRSGGTNVVFRAHRYGPDYPGLAGRDLTPRWGTLTEPATLTGWGFTPGGEGGGGGATGGDGGAGGGY